MGTDDKTGSTPQEALFLESMISLAERTSSSLRGLEGVSQEMVKTTEHCMNERKEAERLTQLRVDALVDSRKRLREVVQGELKELTEKISEVCALAPRQPKWLWCFRELVTLVEKKPLATIVTIFVLLLLAAVLAELGWNVTDWIQPP